MPLHKVRLVCLTMLLVLPRPGRPQSDDPIHRSSGSFDLPCCSSHSKAHIQEAIISCFEQKEYSFPHCPVHAFIFKTVSGRLHCVDPEAPWLSRRFQRLQQAGVYCH